MSSADLAAAARSLIPAGANHYETEVDADNPDLPWIVSNVEVPDDAHTTEGGVSGGDLDVYFTVAGESERSVRLWLDRLVAAYRQRVTCEGWNVGAWVQYQRPRIYPSNVIVGGVSAHVITGVVGYRATVSQLPA